MARRVPREGSLTRAIYDELNEHAGHWFIPKYSCTSTRAARAVEYLRDYYGLDIRCDGRGIRCSLWLLAGEYIDGDYLDYVANRRLP